MRALLACSLLSLPLAGQADLHVSIVQGLGGEPQYVEAFETQVAIVKRSAEALTGPERVTTFIGEQASRDKVLAHLESLGDLSSDDRAAVFLIGHGSFDGFEYKFNLPGPDLTGEDLVVALDAVPAGVQLVVNTSSASGALLDSLKNDQRIVITATRTGGERHATRFGEYFFGALTSAQADINKNGAISAQEAFDYAERQVADWFEFEGRLATEHPKLVGERAAQFTLARLRPQVADNDNPELAILRKQRDDIDSQIEALQLRRDTLSTSEYFTRLERLMLDLALVQEQIDTLDGVDED